MENAFIKNTIIALLILVTSVTLIMTLDSHIEAAQIPDVDYRLAVGNASSLGTFFGDFHLESVDDPDSGHWSTLAEVTKQGDQIKIDFSGRDYEWFGYKIPKFSFVETYDINDTFFPFCIYYRPLELVSTVNTASDLSVSFEILKYLGTVEKEGTEYFVFLHRSGHLEHDLCTYPGIVKHSRNVLDIDHHDISVDHMDSMLRTTFRDTDAVEVIKMFGLGDDFAEEFFAKYPHHITANEPAIEESHTEDIETFDTVKKPLNGNEIFVIIPRDSGTPECADECYIPRDTVIKVGDRVTWINDDTVLHTVTSGVYLEEGGGLDGEFDSGLLGAGRIFSHTFEESGVFPYTCMIYPWMAGVVTVLEDESHVEYEEYLRNNP